VQHIWWAVHILDFIAILIIVATLVAYVVEEKMDADFVRRVSEYVEMRIRHEKKSLKLNGSLTAHESLGNGKLEQKHKPAVKLKAQT